MDRDYLSDAAVVAISRKFVCARLLTYESAEEATFLKSLFTGRSGELENSTFAILAPDGKSKLARAGRSPDFLFRRGPPSGKGRPGAGRDGGNAADFVEILAAIARKHPGRKAAGTPPLPLVEDVRAGLNVGACDGQPVVVTVGTDDRDLAKVNAAVAKVAWSDDFIGRFVFAATTNRSHLRSIANTPKKQVLIVAPDSFGTAGTVLATADVKDEKTLTAAFAKALAAWKAPRKRSTPKHIREGRGEGIHWETEIPVTDPGRPPGGRRGGPPGR